LIGLLVAVATIGIPAALLLPALVAAKRKVLQVHCPNSVRRPAPGRDM